MQVAERDEAISGMVRSMKWTLRPATRSMCLMLVLTFVSTARRANAADIRIDWSAPPECSSANDLQARVMALMGGVVPADLLAVVKVTRAQDTYRANVLLRSGAGFGERRLEAARCNVLVDSLVVLIVLSIPTRVPPATKPALALSLWPEARVLSGSLPSLAAGVGGTIAFEAVSAFRLELHGAYYFPQSTTFEQSMLGANFHLLTFGACICRLWSIARVQWGPCVGAQVHRVSAHGFGGTTQLPGSTSWWGPSLRMLGRAQLLPALGINVAVEAMLPVSRPQFVFSDVGPLHRVSAVALQLSVGPEVKF